MLRLCTLGGCRLERDGAEWDVMPGQRKGLALLALLAAAGDRGLAREIAATYLWPDSDEQRARASLRQLIHALRERLDAPHVLPSGGTLRLDEGIVSSDVVDFNRALKADDHGTAVRVYGGAFLDGFYLKGADEFERWAAAERASLANAHTRALESLAENATVRGDPRDAVEWWRRLVAVDPLSARAATGLMRALASAGERTAALKHGRAYTQLVRDETGASVDPSVEELAARLQATGSSRDAAGPSPSVADAPAPTVRVRTARLPTVAVLPFTNTGGDATDEHFSDGLTDELIGTLGRMPGLVVTARTSVFALKGTSLPTPQIAAMLGVTTLVEGNVRRSDDRVRVGAHLVSAADGAVLWTATLERPARNIFALQEEIAHAIANALRVKLTGALKNLIHPAANLAAYEAYLKGRHILNTRSSKERLLEAIRFFERAAECDPMYAPAFAGLSDAHASLAIFAHDSPGKQFPNAMAAARKALALDDTLAEAHASLAHALFVHDFEWAAAEREFRRAVSLDPGYTFARVAFAICLQDQGRFDEAIAELEHARTTDPLAPHVNAVLGRVYVNARQPDLAIAALNEALRLGPELDLVYQQLGHAFLQKGMHTEAIAALRRAAELSGVRDSAHLAYAFAVSGDRESAQRIVQGLLAASSDPAPPPFHVAMALVGLEEIDAAFQWLERGYAQRASFMDGLMVTPAFSPLTGDPRWASLLRRMGLGR